MLSQVNQDLIRDEPETPHEKENDDDLDCYADGPVRGKRREERRE